MAGRFLLPDGFRLLAAGYEKPGANTVTWGFPVTVFLVAVACAEFRACFLGALRVALPAGDVQGVQRGAGGGVGCGGERFQ